MSVGCVWKNVRDLYGCVRILSFLSYATSSQQQGHCNSLRPYNVLDTGPLASRVHNVQRGLRVHG